MKVLAGVKTSFIMELKSIPRSVKLKNKKLIRENPTHDFGG
jgi:hypothetical protein